MAKKFVKNHTLQKYTLMFLSSFSLFATHLYAENLQKLEVEVWNQYDEFLPQTEQKVVREIQADPNSAYAHYLMSHIYLRRYASDPSRSLVEKALAFEDQAQALDPTGEYGYVALSDIWSALGVNDKALDILKNKPETWRVLYRKAKLEGNIANYKMLSALEKAAKENPDKQEIILPLLISLMEKLPHEGLLEKFQELDSRISHPLIQQALAVQYVASKQHKKAAQIYEKIVADGTQNLEIIINYAIFAYYYLHDSKRALALLESVTKKNLPTSLDSVVHMYMSIVYLQENKDDEFIKTMTKALEYSSNKSATLQFVISGLLERNEPSKLERILNKVQILFPGSADFYALMGSIYYEKLNRNKDAIENFEKAVLLDPTNNLYYDSLGLSYYRINNFYKALEVLDKALAIDPTDSVAMYNKACIYSLLGFSKDAISSLKQAIDLNPALLQLALEDRDFLAIKELSSFKSLKAAGGEGEESSSMAPSDL